jgi:hypothetical protein
MDQDNESSQHVTLKNKVKPVYAWQVLDMKEWTKKKGESNSVQQKEQTGSPNTPEPWSPKRKTKIKNLGNEP